VTFSILRIILEGVSSLIVWTLSLIGGLWWTAGWHFLDILMLRSERLWKCWGYTLRTLYVSLVRPKLEYASWVLRPVYDVHIIRIELMQRKFVRYALRGLGWTDMYDLPPYVDRCALICLETLTRRRTDVLSGRVGSPNLHSEKNPIIFQ
jgi:hypothetical protein